MSDYGGLLFVFPEPKRAEKILERLEQERPFTATASAPDSEIKEVETCLLFFDRKHLHSFCLVRRRRLVATVEYRVLFEEVVSLGDMEIATLGPLGGHRVQVHQSPVTAHKHTQRPPVRTTRHPPPDTRHSQRATASGQIVTRRGISNDLRVARFSFTHTTSLPTQTTTYP